MARRHDRRPRGRRRRDALRDGADGREAADRRSARAAGGRGRPQGRADPNRRGRTVADGDPRRTRSGAGAGPRRSSGAGSPGRRRRARRNTRRDRHTRALPGLSDGKATRFEVATVCSLEQRLGNGGWREVRSLVRRACRLAHAPRRSRWVREVHPSARRLCASEPSRRVQSLPNGWSWPRRDRLLGRLIQSGASLGPSTVQTEQLPAPIGQHFLG